MLAQWSGELPTVICNASGWQENATIISDGEGGYIMAWMDQRGSLNDPEFADIYVQRLSPEGIPQWGTNGLLICGAAHEQDFPQLTLCKNSLNESRIVVVWKDNRDEFNNYTKTKIYAQSLDLNGNILWQPNGVEVADCNGFTSFVPKALSTNSSYNLLIAYRRRDSNFQNESLRVQSISIDTGSKLFDPNGVIVTQGFNQGAQAEMSYSESSPLDINIAWVNYVSPFGYNIYAQKINSNDGSLLWNVSKPICTTSKDQTGIQLQGNYIVWQDWRNDTGYPDNVDIYAQRFDENGNPLWGIDGINLNMEEGTQRYPRIAVDNTNNLWTTWSDFTMNSSDTAYLSVQKITPMGLLPFGLKGKRLNSGDTNSAEGTLVEQDDGTVLLLYQVFGFHSYRYRVHKLNANGEKMWGPLGQPVGGVNLQSIENVREIEGIPLPNGQGAVFAVAEYSDIWAMRAKICETPPSVLTVTSPIKRCTPLVGNASYNLTMESTGCSTGQTRYYERPDGYDYIAATSQTSTNPNRTTFFGVKSSQYIYAECIVDGCANVSPLTPLSIIIATESVSENQLSDYPLQFTDPTYEILSKTQISAINKIEPVSIVNFEATNSIELQPGFMANTGSVFNGEVKACVNLN
ncbi:3-coathanger stack domain-containing protein [uncultured Arcticibacterium sp.]|uniref:3-coathanger stack domain-containing protein n=1 Tax=uncultured Arcticibacterium sp. TaxID=2173042 RepID=UPI0030FBDE64